MRLEANAVSAASAAVASDVADLVRRIAPWTTIYIAPRLLCLYEEGRDDRHGTRYRADGREWQAYSGAAIGMLGIVVVGFTSPQTMFGTACHEAWHAIETRLSDEWKETIDAGLEPMPYGHGNPYWGNAEERRARAFESWCARFLEGLPPFVGTTDVDRIFGMAWSGELGLRLSTPREQRIYA